MRKRQNPPEPRCRGCSSPPTRLSRVGGRVRDASDADAAVAQPQERYELGRLEWARIDASGTPEATLTRAKAALAAASSLV